MSRMRTMMLAVNSDYLVPEWRERHNCYQNWKLIFNVSTLHSCWSTTSSSCF
ncbi:hypothetical protein R6Q59_028254, partial [Mikania micrantha]